MPRDSLGHEGGSALTPPMANEGAIDSCKDPPSENELNSDIRSFELGSEHDGERQKGFWLSMLSWCHELSPCQVVGARGVEILTAVFEGTAVLASLDIER
jgi:hypothetical protein